MVQLKKSLNQLKRQKLLKLVIFSWEKVQTDKRYCFSRLDKLTKSMVAEALFQRRSFSREDLKQAPRTGLGSEKIANKSIIPSIPSYAEGKILSLRLNQERRLAGYMEANRFYLLWFHGKYPIYKH